MERQQFSMAQQFTWITLNYGYMPHNRLAHMFQHLNYTQSKKMETQKHTETNKKIQRKKKKKKKIATNEITLVLNERKKMRTLTYEKKVII